MIIKGGELPASGGRKPYPIEGRQVPIQHFVVRVTTPDNPFPPHKHEQGELWYIIEGQAIVTLDGQDHLVEAGDLIVLEPWIEHGLRTEGQVTWICIG